MAEPAFLDDLKVWVGGSDLTDTLNRVNLTLSKAELGNGRFSDNIEVFKPGLISVGLDLGGFFDNSNPGADSLIGGLAVATTAPTAKAVTLAPPDSPAAAAGAFGNLAYTVVGSQFDYRTGGAHGELLPYDFKTQPMSTYKVYRQTVMRARASATGSEDGTAKQLGAVLAGEEMVITVHGFSVSGATGTYQVVVESDAGSSFAGAETARATGTAFSSGVFTETLKVAGAITDDWWRITLVVVGAEDCNFAASMGIGNIND